MLIVSSFLTLQHSTMNFGNHNTGICNITSNPGNDCVGVRNDSVCPRDTVTNLGNGPIYVQPKLGLSD